MGKIIYHYCCAETFMKIIEGHSLWLTDSRAMNDTTEGKWIIKHLEKYKEEYIKNGGDAKRADFNHKIILHFLEHKDKINLLCCFSENKDLLSQWAMYADDGHGFAIGFDIDKLELKKGQLATGIGRENFIHEFIGLEEVIYDPAEQYDIVKQTLDDHNKYLDDWQKENPSKDFFDHFKRPIIFDDSNEEIIKETILKLANILFIASFSILFKNNAFQAEQEWRIMHSHDIVKGISECAFRQSKIGISPYIIYNFGDKNNCIAEIIIGPQNQSSVFSVRSFLKKNGYNSDDIKIDISKASYRN